MNKSFKAHFQLSTSFFSFPGGKSLSLSLTLLLLLVPDFCRTRLPPAWVEWMCLD